MRADPVRVNASSGQGSSSHNISDLWLYVDGNFQGAYPSGHLMPVISKGEQVRIEVFAGIINNGISDTRLPWNFYQKLQFDTLVSGGQSIVRPLTFSYNGSAQFDWLEDFDGSSGISMIKSGISDTSFVLITGEPAFEGKSAELGMSPADVVAQIESTKSYTLPSGNSNVYLELNYLCTENFEVGLIGSTTELKPAWIGNPTETWKKVYIQLAATVNSEPVSANYSYKIYFRMLNSEGGSPRLFIDNIKLLHL